MVSVMPPTGSDVGGPHLGLGIARGTAQHLPVSYRPEYQLQYAPQGVTGYSNWGHAYGQVLGSSGSSCHSTSSTEDSRVPPAAPVSELSTGVVTRGKAMSNAVPRVAPQKSISRGKGKGKRIESKSVGKKTPSQGKGKGGKGRQVPVGPKVARSRGKNINNLPKTTAESYANPTPTLNISRGKMMPPPPAPPVVQTPALPAMNWERNQVLGNHFQQYFLRRRPVQQRSVFDPSKGDGGPPRVRSFGPNSSSAGQSLFVDCSVEYELPALREAQVEDNREPLLIIHPGWRQQQRITRSRSQQRLLEQQGWFRHQQLAMLQQQQFAAQQQHQQHQQQHQHQVTQQQVPQQEMYHQQFRPLVAQPQCYPHLQQYHPQAYNHQGGQFSHPCCPPQVAKTAAAVVANSRKRTFDQVTFSMAPSCQVGYGGIMSDQHPIIRRANPSVSSSLALGPTATKRAKVQSEQPKRKVCSCGLVLDNVNQGWPMNCPAQPHLLTQQSPHKAIWNGMQLRSHPTATTATVTSGSSVVANTGVGAAAVVARWNGNHPNLPGYYHHPHPHPHLQPVFNNNNSCPYCPNVNGRYRSV